MRWHTLGSPNVLMSFGPSRETQVNRFISWGVLTVLDSSLHGLCNVATSVHDQQGQRNRILVLKPSYLSFITAFVAFQLSKFSQSRAPYNQFGPQSFNCLRIMFSLASIWYTDSKIPRNKL